MNSRLRLVFALSAGVFADVPFAEEADRFAAVTIEPKHVAGSVHMLQGAGGNIGVSVGSDGTLLVDDQFAPLAERIQTAIDGLGGHRPRLILNTHFHGDHVGGNAAFGASGIILAHENVRLRLLDGDLPRQALPVVTYLDRIRLYFNDDEIDVIHLPRGHTDGDSVVWFKQANVVHMGDQFFNGRFPFIDVDSGGTVDGYLANIETVLDMIAADTHIIPGHGPLATVVDLAQAADVIMQTRARVLEAKAAGDLEGLIERGLSDKWRAWGSGFITEERWIRIISVSDAQASDTGAGVSTNRARN